MNDVNVEPELSVGGSQGIHLRTGAPPVRPALLGAGDAFPRLPALTRQGQRWIATYGRAVVVGLVILGTGALALGMTVIQGLSLPWLFYLPVLTAGGVFWAAALALTALRRSSGRALAAAAERDVLQLAARTAGPLTVHETARSLGLSLADAEAVLIDMSRAGHIAMDVDLDTGHLQFTAPRSLPLRDHSPTDLRR